MNSHNRPTNTSIQLCFSARAFFKAFRKSAGRSLAAVRAFTKTLQSLHAVVGRRPLVCGVDTTRVVTSFDEIGPASSRASR